MKPLIIVGSGPSACQYEYPNDHDIMAVSSGYRDAPWIDHFVTLDKVMHFPEWLTRSTRLTVHTARMAFSYLWETERSQLQIPREKTVLWPYLTGDNPTFKLGGFAYSGSLRLLNADGVRHNSLLFAVQVAGMLGYQKCTFIGCDMLLPILQPISDELKRWYPAAKMGGIEWFNASPLSTLCEWMPNAERMMVPCSL